MTIANSSLLEISDDQRRTVRAMAGFGMPVADIAAYLETDAATLRRHMGVELDRAALEANAKVAQALFTMATQQHNVAAAIFWMKARALWRDRPDERAAPSEPGPPIKVIYTWADGSPASLGAIAPEVGNEKPARPGADPARDAILVHTGVPRKPKGVPGSF